MTLATHEFIRRFLLHVLPCGFHRILHYGLLAGSNRKNCIALARKLLRVASPPEDEAVKEPPDTGAPCPCSGGQMVVIEFFARWKQPRAPPSGTLSIRETVNSDSSRRPRQKPTATKPIGVRYN